MKTILIIIITTLSFSVAGQDKEFYEMIIERQSKVIEELKTEDLRKETVIFYLNNENDILDKKLRRTRGAGFGVIALAFGSNIFTLWRVHYYKNK